MPMPIKSLSSLIIFSLITTLVVAGVVIRIAGKSTTMNLNSEAGNTDAKATTQPSANAALQPALKALRYEHGRLTYRRKSTGVERGREDWWLTHNRDGSRTMRTLSTTDDSRFVRDVTYTLGRDGRPTDTFIRLQVAEQFIGAGYFRLAGDQMFVIADGLETGHVTQTVKVPTDLFSITTHAVMLDGWIWFNYDRSKLGEQTRTFYNTSTKWNGTDGPLGRMETYRIRFIGDEEITVPAGKFPAKHFTMDSDLLKVPTSHLWVSGEDAILLRYDWNDYDLEYVLTQWAKE